MPVNQKTKDEDKSKAEFIEKIIGQLMCPICYETCFPPIYLCNNGHGVCATCQTKLKFCSECRAPGKPTSRSVQLEKIAELLRIPCENQKWGCTRTFFNEHEMSKHFADCGHGFVCYVCRDWKGSPDALDKHVATHHAAYHAGKVPCNTSVRYWTTVFTDRSMHDQPHFYLLKVGADVFWMELLYNSATNISSTTLRIVSRDESDAKRYEFSVQFRPQGESAYSKLSYETRVGLNHSTEGRMLFILPPDITQSEDGKVWYNLTITTNTKPFFGLQPWR